MSFQVEQTVAEFVGKGVIRRGAPILGRPFREKNKQVVLAFQKNMGLSCHAFQSTDERRLNWFGAVASKEKSRPPPVTVALHCLMRGLEKGEKDCLSSGPLLHVDMLSRHGHTWIYWDTEFIDNGK